MNRIRKGDEVVVITGGDKGKRGVVATILKNDRIVVEGVNIRKKHVKANPAMGVEGGIIAKKQLSMLLMWRSITPKHKKLTVSVTNLWTVKKCVFSSRPARSLTDLRVYRWHV